MRKIPIKPFIEAGDIKFMHSPREVILTLGGPDSFNKEPSVDDQTKIYTTAWWQVDNGAKKKNLINVNFMDDVVEDITFFPDDSIEVTLNGSDLFREDVTKIISLLVSKHGKPCEHNERLYFLDSGIVLGGFHRNLKF
jgi:hypothetical protein